MNDPFASPVDTAPAASPAGDPFASARSGFIQMKDLVGRLILAAPLSVETRDSTKYPGKKFDSYTCDVIVLDGPITEMIETIPFTVDGMWLAGGQIGPQLASSLRKKGLVLGRMTQVPSNKGADAWVLSEPTDQDKAIARGPANAYLAQNAPFSSAK